MTWHEVMKLFVALVTIVNPLGNVPVYLQLIEGFRPKQQKRILRVVGWTMFWVLSASLFLGQSVLAFFGVSFAAFRIGAGLILILLAFSLLHGQLSSIKHTPEEVDEAVQQESVAVMPLGIPLLAGPGAVSTTILYAQQFNTPTAKLVQWGVILCVTIISIAVLSAASWFARSLGRRGILICGRLMGLILVAVGVEFVIEGIKQAFGV